VSKLLLIVVVIAAVYVVVRAYARSVARGSAAAAKPASKDEDMVRCHHCGVHLPRSESLGIDGQSFCSEEHRRLHSG